MKNIDYVIKKVAEKNNINEKLVDKIIKYHWRKDIKTEVISMDHAAIYLRYLGTIVFSPVRTNKAIHKIITTIRRLKDSIKFKESSKVLITEKYKDRLRKLLVQRNLQAIKYIEKGHAIENKRISKASASRIEESKTSTEGMD
jgi:hypothetical protein